MSVWWLGDFIILALAWTSSHHLPQGSSYHQNSVKHLSNRHEYINIGKTDEIWTWSITGLTTIVLHRSGAAVRKKDTGTVLCKIRPWEEHQSQKELSQVSNDHYTPSNDWLFRRYDFRMMTELLKLYFGLFGWDSYTPSNDHLHALKIKFWGCLDGILSLIWIEKSLATLRTLHRLLIQPHPTKGLEIIEFWRSASLLNSVWNRTAVERNWTFGSRIDRNSGSPKYHYGSQLHQLSIGL
jgi:hypothetical protein